MARKMRPTRQPAGLPPPSRQFTRCQNRGAGGTEEEKDRKQAMMSAAWEPATGGGGEMSPVNAQHSAERKAQRRPICPTREAAELEHSPARSLRAVSSMAYLT